MVYSPTAAAMTRLGFDPTGVRTQNFSLGGDPTGVRSARTSGFGGDPTGIDKDILGFGGTDPLLDFGMQAFAADLAKKQADSAQFDFWGQSQTGGMGSTVGGDWAGVERWNAAIQSAAAQYGIPANMIKAVMKLESNGDPDAAGAEGVWGPMQVYGKVWGYGPWMTDPVANIAKGAEILKSNLTTYGNWYDALRHYHGIGSDGYTTDTQYADIVMGNYNQLNNLTGGAAGGAANYGITPRGANLSSMFDSQNISQEFNIPSGAADYSYGGSYGLSGSVHTGLDIAMPLNTPYRSPMSGVVTCAGTGNGRGADGGGCAAFNDYMGSGAGRVEVLLDNGVVLIFGHSSRAAVQPGQRVTAGQLIGYSGGMNGAHVHLEARVRDASQPSGYRIVDPRIALGSTAPAYGGSSGGGFFPQTSQAQTNPFWYFLTTPGAKW